MRRKEHKKTTGMAGFVEPGYGSILVRTVWMKRFKEQNPHRPKSLRKHHTKQAKKKKRRWSDKLPFQKSIRRFSQRTRPTSY